MKDETIIGNCDSNGLFTAKNPYTAFQSLSKYHDFKNSHPPLFCYNENNELVKGVEGVEVKLQRQYYSNSGVWINYEYSEDFYLTVQGYETRMIYISVHSKGTTLDKLNAIAKTDSKFVEKAQARKEQRTPLPEAQPLEGVKTAIEQVIAVANETMPKEFFSAQECYLKGVEFGYKHAQFATDAGVWKDYRWFIETSFNGYTPIKMALQELSDGTINESECTEVIANAYIYSTK